MGRSLAPYLTLLPEDAGQRHDELREVYNGLRWIVRTGATWRMMAHDLPPGRLSINRRNGGWRQAALKRWSRICVCCYAASKAAWVARFRRLARDYV